jgi:hypothetical protein
MRVVAFWAAIAGLVALAGQGSVLVLSLTGAEQDALWRTAGQLAAVGQIAFTLLLVVFLLIVAVTGRKVSA